MSVVWNCLCLPSGWRAELEACMVLVGAWRGLGGGRGRGGAVLVCSSVELVECILRVDCCIGECLLTRVGAVLRW